mmetsp:Transcript_15131/g.63860  ORF Transcript_15131/g.63860 Transcript_15131/m.63860 type:complete len:240 (+) Transcript_15131:1003-1722(+)
MSPSAAPSAVSREAFVHGSFAKSTRGLGSQPAAPPNPFSRSSRIAGHFRMRSTQGSTTLPLPPPEFERSSFARKGAPEGGNEREMLGKILPESRTAIAVKRRLPNATRKSVSRLKFDAHVKRSISIASRVSCFRSRKGTSSSTVMPFGFHVFPLPARKRQDMLDSPETSDTKRLVSAGAPTFPFRADNAYSALSVRRGQSRRSRCSSSRQCPSRQYRAITNSQGLKSPEKSARRQRSDG